VAATLEIPYTQPTCPLDAALARAYGASLLRAWVRTQFLPAEPDASRGANASDRLLTGRANFQRSYRGKPAEAEKAADAIRADETAPAVLRVEATAQLAQLRLHQKRYADALQLADAVARDPNATAHQRATAAVRRVRIAVADPATTPAAVEAQVTAAAAVPYAAADQLAEVFEVAGDFFTGRNDERALEYARRGLAVAGPRTKGRALNRIAAVLDRLGRSEEAIQSRREAAQAIRPILKPVPVGISGAQLVGDLFEALTSIPDATREEKREAARLVIEHKISTPAMREKARKALAALGAD
jgi:hypothetical protein